MQNFKYFLINEIFEFKFVSTLKIVLIPNFFAIKKALR